MTEETARPKGFTVRNFIDTAELKKDLSYSLNELSNAFRDQASLLVHYGTLASKASKQVDDCKLVLEATEAAVYRKLRDEAASAGEKVTEEQLKKNVAVHARVVSIKRALNEARQIEANAKIAVESFRHRKDMLVQQGLHSREEMKGELRASTGYARDQEAEDTKNRLLDRIGRQAANGA